MKCSLSGSGGCRCLDHRPLGILFMRSHRDGFDQFLPTSPASCFLLAFCGACCRLRNHPGSNTVLPGSGSHLRNQFITHGASAFPDPILSASEFLNILILLDRMSQRISDFFTTGSAQFTMGAVRLFPIVSQRVSFCRAAHGAASCLLTGCSLPDMVNGLPLRFSAFCTSFRGHAGCSLPGMFMLTTGKETCKHNYAHQKKPYFFHEIPHSFHFFFWKRDLMYRIDFRA